MFASFNKAFKKESQSAIKIPQELIEVLNSHLPEGLQYELDEKENALAVMIKSENVAISINVDSVIPTAEQAEVLGEDYSLNDLFRLSYNSQKPIQIQLKDNVININGKDVPFEEMCFNPLNPVKIIERTTLLMPKDFPPKFPLSFGNGNVSIELMIKRVPNNSIHVCTYESDTSHCLIAKYSYDEKSKNFSLTLKVMLSTANSVKEILDSIEIYNAFVEGKGWFAGEPLTSKISSVDCTPIDGRTIEFWRKVFEIEKELGITFLPPFNRTSEKDICIIEELYQNIINKVPIKQDRRVTSITSAWDPEKDKIASENLKKSIYFEFQGNSSLKVFGNELELPCLIGISNAIFADYKVTEETKECKVYFEDLSENKKMFISILRFKNESELDKYRADEEERPTAFNNAKPIIDYLPKDE